MESAFGTSEYCSLQDFIVLLVLLVHTGAYVLYKLFIFSFQSMLYLWPYPFPVFVMFLYILI